MHLANNNSKHVCIKTFIKQDLDIPGYQFVIHETINFAEYQMSHKADAGKAFSAPMPVYIAFFGLITKVIGMPLLKKVVPECPQNLSTVF
jgi:hypothetical protein